MMESYKAFVQRNAGLLSLVESGLSSLTWLLPERFEGGELGIEAVHTALGLLSTFHDSIVSTPPGTTPPPGSELALALSALEQVQVLLELVATRREERGIGSRYTSLAFLESIKALVRLVVWQRSCSRLLLQGGIGNLQHRAAQLGANAVAQGRPQEVYGAFAAFRERRCKPRQLQQQEQAPDRKAAVGTDQPNTSRSRVDEGDSKPNATSAARKRRQLVLPQRLLVTAEVLHILRPVIYALALRRWGRRSWKPWMISLGIDLLSMQLGTAAAKAMQSSAWFGTVQPANLGPSLMLLQCLQQTRWAGEEEQELSARRLRLLVYLLRDPLFSRYTQAALESWVRGTSRVPLVGWLSGRAVDILVGVQRYYTYVERMASS